MVDYDQKAYTAVYDQFKVLIIILELQAGTTCGASSQADLT